MDYNNARYRIKQGQKEFIGGGLAVVKIILERVYLFLISVFHEF